MPPSGQRPAPGSQASLTVVAGRYADLAASPFAPGSVSVRLHYREAGAGPPLLILHGGWGYEAYPFDRQIASLASSRRLVVPDRTGYGRSGRLPEQPIDFHRRAAGEMLALMDALALEQPVLWGHSDGAVIALLMALSAPHRIGGVIAESTHFFRTKPASRQFFETMRDAPDALGPRLAAVLALEHGGDWRHVIATSGAAWLRLAALGGDLYDGRLQELRVPALILHGTDDPRTEPGELDALRSALATAARSAGRADGVRAALLSGGGHSPHSASATADEATGAAVAFISALADSGVSGISDVSGARR